MSDHRATLSELLICVRELMSVIQLRHLSVKNNPSPYADEPLKADGGFRAVLKLVAADAEKMRDAMRGLDLNAAMEFALMSSVFLLLYKDAVQIRVGVGVSSTDCFNLFYRVKFAFELVRKVSKDPIVKQLGGVISSGIVSDVGFNRNIKVVRASNEIDSVVRGLLSTIGSQLLVGYTQDYSIQYPAVSAALNRLIGDLIQKRVDFKDEFFFDILDPPCLYLASRTGYSDDEFEDESSFGGDDFDENVPTKSGGERDSPIHTVSSTPATAVAAHGARSRNRPEGSTAAKLVSFTSALREMEKIVDKSDGVIRTARSFTGDTAKWVHAIVCGILIMFSSAACAIDQRGKQKGLGYFNLSGKVNFAVRCAVEMIKSPPFDSDSAQYENILKALSVDADKRLLQVLRPAELNVSMNSALIKLGEQLKAINPVLTDAFGAECAAGLGKAAKCLMQAGR